MANKKSLDSLIQKISEKVSQDPKKAARLVTDWTQRPSKKSAPQTSIKDKTIVRKKVA